MCGCEECVEVDLKYLMTCESFLITTSKCEILYRKRWCTFLDLDVQFGILCDLDVMSLKTVEDVYGLEKKLHICA